MRALNNNTNKLQDFTADTVSSTTKKGIDRVTAQLRKCFGFGLILVVAVLFPLTSAASPADQAADEHVASSAGAELHSTAADFLGLSVKPIAIGHHGVGSNPVDGQLDPTRPIENTVPSVREAYRDGVSVVEIDVQLMADGEIAVFHDDFLPDLTCLDTLTLAQLQEKLPYVPSLQAVLEQAKQWNRKESRLSGIMIVELKALSPLCDPTDSLESTFVSNVVRVIRQMKMTDQVIFDGFSPTLLSLAKSAAPEIARELDFNFLQLLPADQVTAITGLPVKFIDKEQFGCGLQWAELGFVFRLPGYTSPEQVICTALAVEARAVGVDRQFLEFVPGSGAPLVSALHAFGLKAFGWPARNEAEWNFFAGLGFDAIYMDDVPTGVRLQPPLP